MMMGGECVNQLFKLTSRPAVRHRGDAGEAEPPPTPPPPPPTFRTYTQKRNDGRENKTWGLVPSPPGDRSAGRSVIFRFSGVARDYVKLSDDSIRRAAVGVRPNRKRKKKKKQNQLDSFPQPTPCNLDNESNYGTLKWQLRRWVLGYY